MTFADICEHILKLSILTAQHYAEHRRKQRTETEPPPWTQPQAQEDLEEFLDSLPQAWLSLLVTMLAIEDDVAAARFIDAYQAICGKRLQKDELAVRLKSRGPNLALQLAHAAHELCQHPEHFLLFQGKCPDTRKPLPSEPDLDAPPPYID